MQLVVQIIIISNMDDEKYNKQRIWGGNDDGDEDKIAAAAAAVERERERGSGSDSAC